MVLRGQLILFRLEQILLRDTKTFRKCTFNKHVNHPEYDLEVYENLNFQTVACVVRFKRNHNL